MSALEVDATQTRGSRTVPEENGKLYAYKGGFEKAVIAASLLIPYGFVLFLVFFCENNGGAYALNANVKITQLAFAALMIHGLYFIGLPIGFELFIELLPCMPFLGESTYFGKLPANPDNLVWMMTCLSGELFFVAAACVLLMASQDQVPRWTLIVPMAQCVYNMKNSLLWVFLGPIFSPIGKRNTVMIIDWLTIGSCFAIYIQLFFSESNLSNAESVANALVK